MNGDHTSPRKATSPKLVPATASAPTDDDDAPLSSKSKAPTAASPKALSVKPPPADEDDKPLSSKSPKAASPRPAKAQKLEDDDKPIGIQNAANMAPPAPSPRLPSASTPTSAAPKAAQAPATRPASSSATPTTGAGSAAVKPSPTTAPDLQSILSKVKALAAQSAVVQASKSPRTAAAAPSSKRPKVLESSDDDDDKPLSARTSSSLKPHASSSSKQHSSSSSKHHSSHSSHDKKKRDHHHSSPSKSRNSGALLGDATTEFKSVGKVFMSSDRGTMDMLIAGILSRWWYGIEWPPANHQPTVDKTWKPLVGFSFVYEGPDGRIHNIREAVAAATKGAATVDPKKVNVGPPTYDNLATMSKKDLKALLIRCLENQIAAVKDSDPQFHGKSLRGELHDFLAATSRVTL